RIENSHAGGNCHVEGPQTVVASKDKRTANDCLWSARDVHVRPVHGQKRVRGTAGLRLFPQSPDDRLIRRAGAGGVLGGQTACRREPLRIARAPLAKRACAWLRAGTQADDDIGQPQRLAAPAWYPSSGTPSLQ